MADAAETTRPMTVADFLDFLDTRPETENWALLDGEPVKMMAGGTGDHADIAETIGLSIGQAARRAGCRGYRSDLLVRHPTEEGGSAAPDIFVSCGDRPGMERAVSDPIVVIEVLSPSTMNLDRGRKLELYRSIPTVRHIFLVYQDEMRIEAWTPGERIWDIEVLTTPSAEMRVPELDWSMDLAAVYEGVVFQPRGPRLVEAP